MSAFLQADTEFEDPQMIIECLNALGYSDIEVHDEAQPLKGYQGDVREQKANIIVRRKHITASSNDMGFEKTEEGKYIFRYSDYDRSALPRKHGYENIQMMVGRIKHDYSCKVVKKAAKKGKWRVKSVPVEGGTTMILTRWRQ